MPESLRTVFLDGPVHYADFGGSGTPIVCVHGLGGSHQNWLAVGPLLAARHRVVALDLVGFGLTPPSGRSSHVRAHRRLLAAFLREVIGEPAILMGNSMGGLVSMLQAEAEPSSVSALVLINPALPVKGLHFDPVVVRDFAAFALPGLGERTLRRRGHDLSPRQQVERTMGLVTVDPARVDPAILARAEELAKQRRGHDWAVPAFLESARSLFRTMASRRAHRRRVAAIDAPALVIHGTHDRLVAVAAAEELVGLRPDWQLTVLDEIGHVPMMEAPQLTVEIVEGWLDDVRRSTVASVSEGA